MPSPPWTGERSMAVITVSRQLGSLGGDIASSVAQELGLRLIDAGTINQAAERAGVPRIALAELETEGERGLASRVLTAMRAMPLLPSGGSRPAMSGDVASPRGSTTTFPFGGLFSPTVPPISSSVDGYVRMAGLVIRGLAREGNVLILGRGGQMLLRNYPGALHVQTVAPFASRVEVVISRYGLSERVAQQRVRASDRARFDYLRRYHDVDWLDPTLYHLVLNTASLPAESAIELIVAAQRMVDQIESNADADETSNE